MTSGAPLGARVQSTEISIRGEQFLINGRPTYAGRTYRGMKIEGLLMNVRAVQAVFDDLNPVTRSRWAYPDTGRWDPDRNVREFISALPQWWRHGVLAFTVNLQGGSPEGYSKEQPWENSGIDVEGNLRPAYMARLARVLEEADHLGMAAIVGYFYFGQDQRVKDEAAVRRALRNATEWLLATERRNVLVEINNECNVRYHHEILKPARVDELIEEAKGIKRRGRRLLVGTSYGGGTPAEDNVVRTSDFLLLHGNGPDDPSRIRNMVRTSRGRSSWRPMPVLITEDDHFRFDDPDNHMMTAIGEYVSWGFFDPGKNDYVDGYQCPPVNWGINTERKRQFFAKVKAVTGA